MQIGRASRGGSRRAFYNPLNAGSHSNRGGGKPGSPPAPGGYGVPTSAGAYAVTGTSTGTRIAHELRGHVWLFPERSADSRYSLKDAQVYVQAQNGERMVLVRRDASAATWAKAEAFPVRK